MKIPKAFGFISVVLNLILVAALVDYAVFVSNKTKSSEKPRIFPVVLIQKINTELHALNLFNQSVYLDNKPIAPAKISDSKVQTTKIIRTPLTISWDKKVSPFPTDFAKEAPSVVDILEKPACRICIVKDKNWTIRKGQYEVDEMLIIPENVTFTVQSGTVLNFGMNGGIFSRSAIKAYDAQFKGKGWKGITILNQSSEESEMKNCQLQGGKGFEIFGMKYTGTLNFILGKISLSELTFENSQSEDALNVKWISGKISNTKFINSLSDSLDADWSELTLSDLIFHSAINDCLDFSGGKISINNVELKGCQDKAISNGENNKLQANNVSIAQSKTAIANKDGAEIRIKNSLIQNSETAIHQYHQKMFYPEPLSYLEENLKIEQVTTHHKIESGKVTGHESL